ncbi:MAG TPA: hypothetical protein PKD53_22990 [Chloroflexaceae bacterium]|nr:hypothetical protein [Chloroflexaceae bacterium]
MRTITRRLTTGAAMLALAVGLAACAPARPQAAQPGAAETAGRPVPEVVITAREYSFSGPDSIPGGWTQITLDNQGAKTHDLILFRMDEGKTMDDVMGALESEGPPEWITLVGQTTAEAGERKRFIAELAEGSYGMISFGAEQDGPPDAAQGMVKAMTVTTAPAGEVALPAADGTVEMADFSYAVSGVAAGTQLVRVANTGAEDHEAVIFRINEGKSFADVRALLELPEEEQEQQYGELVTQVDGVMAGPGQTVYAELELEPGSYALICFLPSPANEGRPHYELGMLQELVVE